MTTQLDSGTSLQAPGRGAEWFGDNQPGLVAELLQLGVLRVERAQVTIGCLLFLGPAAWIATFQSASPSRLPSNTLMDLRLATA
jgi:hypothetical protein